MEESIFGDGPGTRLAVGCPQEWTLLNDPGFDSSSTKHNRVWDHYFTSMIKFIPYDTTQEHNIKLIFNMTESLYPNEEFGFGLDTVAINYYINSNDDGTYSLSMDRNPPVFAPGAEPQPVCPQCGSKPAAESTGNYSSGYDPLRPDMEIEYKTIVEHHDVLLDLGGYETIEYMLRDNFASDWVDEFLIKYPEFKIQSTMTSSPIFNFLLPSAHGQTQHLFASGNVLIQDYNGDFLVPQTPIIACLVDSDTTDLSADPVVVQYSSKDVCKPIAPDGSFSLIAINDDPNANAPNDLIDAQVRFHLLNEKTQLVSGDNAFNYFYTPLERDVTSFRLDLTNFKIPNTDNFANQCQIFNIVNDGTGKTRST